MPPDAGPPYEFNAPFFSPKGKWGIARMLEIDPNILEASLERFCAVFDRVSEEADAEFATHDLWRELND